MTSDSVGLPPTPGLDKLGAWCVGHKWRLMLLGVLLFFVCFWLASYTWYSAEIKGRVVAPDGRPLVGAIVVANWERKHWMHGISLGQLAVHEVVTNQNGEFILPQWGPLFLPDGEASSSLSRIRIFYPNYVPLVEYHFDRKKSLNPGDLSREHLREHALVLKPFQGSMAEYEEVLYGLSHSTSFAIFGDDPCGWKKIPHLTLALRDVKSALVREGLGKDFQSLYETALVSQALCGDAEKFFQAFQKNKY